MCAATLYAALCGYVRGINGVAGSTGEPQVLPPCNAAPIPYPGEVRRLPPVY